MRSIQLRGIKSINAEMSLSTIARAVLVLVIIVVLLFLILKSIKGPKSLFNCVDSGGNCLGNCSDQQYHYAPGDASCKEKGDAASKKICCKPAK